MRFVLVSVNGGSVNAARRRRDSETHRRRRDDHYLLVQSQLVMIYDTIRYDTRWGD